MSASGLSRTHRIRARDLAVNAALLGWHHRAAMHYTEGPHRWDGIARRLKAWRGEFPNYADCSAFVTWCLWNGLSHYHVHHDNVNGDSFRGGYTGTMVNHGDRVHNLDKMLRADAVLYGDPFGRTGHVAIHIGDHKVISFGSEIGPLLLPMNYREITQVRRYI